MPAGSLGRDREASSLNPQVSITERTTRSVLRSRGVQSALAAIVVGGLVIG